MLWASMCIIEMPLIANPTQPNLHAAPALPFRASSATGKFQKPVAAYSKQLASRDKRDPQKVTT